MSSVRMTTAAPRPLERSGATPAERRDELRPVVGADSVDADRRRSVQEELSAAEERFPTRPSEDPAADTREVVEALGRLDSEEAAKVLQPIDARKLRHVLSDHVDEQA